MFRSLISTSTVYHKENEKVTDTHKQNSKEIVKKERDRRTHIDVENHDLNYCYILLLFVTRN